MVDSLKGPALYVVGAIILAVIGAVTFLAANGNVSGGDALTVYTGVLTVVAGVGGGVVVGHAVTTAANSSPAGVGSTAVVPPPTPAADPPAPTVV